MFRHWDAVHNSGVRKLRINGKRAGQDTRQRSDHNQGRCQTGDKGGASSRIVSQEEPPIHGVHSMAVRQQLRRGYISFHSQTKEAGSTTSHASDVPLRTCSTMRVRCMTENDFGAAYLYLCAVRSRCGRPIDIPHPLCSHEGARLRFPLLPTRLAVHLVHR